jgi:renalase
MNIAIIGAGMAGASAAQHLQYLGHRVTVFDKSRGAGGRMSTRRGDGWSADHGAQYFTASDPDFQAAVAQWCAHGAAAPWTGRILAQRGETSEVSESVTRYVGVPEMKSPVQHLLQGLGPHFGHTVNGLRHDGRGWHLTTAEHGEWCTPFDAVALTLPLIQTQAFEAWLPAEWTQQWRDNVAMQPCWTLMAQWPAPLDWPFDGLFANDPMVDWLGCNSSKPGRAGMTSWTVQTTAAWSEDHLDDSAENVSKALLAWLATRGAPTPSGYTAHRWRYARSTGHASAPALWDTVTRVGVAGDWMCAGKVQGAWRSGRALAERIGATEQQ